MQHTTNKVSTKSHTMLHFLSSSTKLTTLLLVLVLISCKFSPSTPQPNPTNDFLSAHNQARSEVSVPPLQWNQAMAKSASLTVRLQRDKQNCSFANLTQSRYGGNQLWASGPTAVTPRAAVETWVAEKEFYVYQNNTCVVGHQCGVYTQVVWRKSNELGCAQALCPKQSSSLTVCFYNPPGNVVGEKPY